MSATSEDEMSTDDYTPPTDAELDQVEIASRSAVETASLQERLLAGEVLRVVRALREARAEIRRLHAEREMLASDTGAYLGYGDDGLQLFASAGDVFEFATVDAEPVPDDQFWPVYNLWKDHGEAGLLAWVIERRGQEPFHPYSEPFQNKLTAARAAVRAAKAP